MRKLLNFITTGLALACPLSMMSSVYADDAELSIDAPFDPSNPESRIEPLASSQLDQSGLIVESLKSSNYENMTLEEVQKVLQKKQELARTLDNQLRIKATRDQQKRALLDQLAKVDEENKKKLLELKQPFKK
jgi:Mg/Co/Ni transporter MgtE